MAEPPVRPAAPGDADSVADLNRHVHELHVAAEPMDFHPTELAEVRAFFASVLSQPKHMLFVVGDPSLYGYIWAEEVRRPRTAFTSERHLAHIHHIAVAPKKRRTGAGRALVGAVEAEAEKRGCTNFALDHWSFNHDAATFFSDLGFENYNVRMRRLG